MVSAKKEKQKKENSDDKPAQGWDSYWSEKNKVSNNIYDRIAKFYRKYIMTNIFDHFIKKNFSSGSTLLHAGCGGGYADICIVDYATITALDNSSNALEIYKKNHGDKCKVILGDILNLPFENKTFDGIYNQGVMEHFSEDEIKVILSEFKRILRDDGKLVIFWPPTFGSTTNTLDALHFILNKILRRNIQLHPPEVSRINSKKHATEIFSKAGFSVVDYYFGAKDFFTQVVIVAKKSDS
ncbi:MAG: methyltransferase domain-containing protein [Nanoarchaeota archaeon]|nr:methyltransferase domain-containing protein [Nanoarchaeota archaeon]